MNKLRFDATESNMRYKLQWKFFVFVAKNSSDKKKSENKIIWKNEKAVVRTGYCN